MATNINTQNSEISPQNPPLEEGNIGRDILRAVLATVVLTILLGAIYPAVIWGVSQLAFSKQANGSVITNQQGQVIGSEIIGQSFAGENYFHGRPSGAFTGSVVSTQGITVEITTSGGNNFGPTDARLLGNEGTINSNAQQVISETGIASGTVPVDLVTASASGLDPHISPAGAEVQVARVAKARNLDEDRVRALVARYTEGRELGVLGEPRVNVLRLNLALDRGE